MKSKFTLLLVLVATTIATYAQQIPNAGFETWSGGSPTSWVTWESLLGGAPLGLTTRDTTRKVEGAASIRIVTDSVQAGPTKRLIPGFASLGSGTYAPPAPPVFNGIPFTFRPDTLTFAYRYSGVGNDSAYLEITLSATNGNLLAGGLLLGSTANQWVLVSIPMTAQLSPGVADSLNLFFSSSGIAPVAGSELNVDALRFGYINPPTFVEEIDNNVKVSVFPNPANTFARIQLSENMDGSVMVFDMNGRVVTHELFFGNGHVMNTSTWANGVYSYTILNQQGVAKAKGLLNVAH